MKSMPAIAALALFALVLPNVAAASQPEVRLSSMDRPAEDSAASKVAQQLLAATAAVEFAIELPDDYVSFDPDYDPLAGWTPD